MPYARRNKVLIYQWAVLGSCVIAFKPLPLRPCAVPSKKLLCPALAELHVRYNYARRLDIYNLLDLSQPALLPLKNAMRVSRSIDDSSVSNSLSDFKNLHLARGFEVSTASAPPFEMP